MQPTSFCFADPTLWYDHQQLFYPYPFCFSSHFEMGFPSRMDYQPSETYKNMKVED
jgi:hypothetical protein